MEPVKFEECNVVYGDNQEEYVGLPAHKTPDGQVLMCFQLDEDEIEEMRKTGKMWISLLTFNKPLQPICLSSKNIWFAEQGEKDQLHFEL